MAKTDSKSSGLDLKIYAQITQNHDAYDCKWVPHSNSFVTIGGKGSGVITVHTLKKGKTNTAKQIASRGVFKCGTFSASHTEERQLATGSFDGMLHVWDLEHSELPVYSAKAHSQFVNCIDGVGASVDDPSGSAVGPVEIVTGGRDGTINVWDTRQKDTPVMRIQHHTKSDCWTVSIANRGADYSARSVLGGFENGDLVLIDLAKGCIVWASNVQDGICSTSVSAQGDLLATTVAAKFHVFDTRNDVHITKKNNQGTIWSGRYTSSTNPSGDIIATAGGAAAGSLNIYRSKRAGATLHDIALIHKSSPTPQPLLSFDWCREKNGLCAFSALDQSVTVAYFPALA